MPVRWNEWCRSLRMMSDVGGIAAGRPVRLHQVVDVLEFLGPIGAGRGAEFGARPGQLDHRVAHALVDAILAGDVGGLVCHRDASDCVFALFARFVSRC